MTTDYTAVFDAINNATRDELALLGQAVKNRRTALDQVGTMAAVATINLGDTVKINGDVRPKHFASQPARVTKIEPGSKYPFTVELIDPVANTRGRQIKALRLTGTSITKVA